MTRRLVGIFAAVMMVVSSALADETCIPAKDPVLKVFGCTSSPCIVGHNMGGLIDDFAAALKEIERRQKMEHRQWTVVFTGDCGSTCALFLDRGRHYVKITRQTMLLFHQARELHDGDYSCTAAGVVVRPGSVPIRYFAPPQSSDVDEKVRKRGGYPQDDFLTIPAWELGIWELYKLEPQTN